ncbi:hypothetical protein EKD04_015015 [Chloroflexales bacterium ZM16-3]|nr:hypothetical protein [Chloroflexales bacterium ZM16-3]
MAELKKRAVRKGRIYQVRVADVEYRTFIWEDGTWFSGRVEDNPQIQPCRARTAIAVREQLLAALSASLAS